MWVIYSTDTGEEKDRIENYDAARDYVKYLNALADYVKDQIADYDHYAKRWED